MVEVRNQSVMNSNPSFYPAWMLGYLVLVHLPIGFEHNQLIFTQQIH